MVWGATAQSFVELAESGGSTRLAHNLNARGNNAQILRFPSPET